MGMIEIKQANIDQKQALSDIGLASWMSSIGHIVPADVVERFKHENPFSHFVECMGARLLVGYHKGIAAGIAGREREDQIISDVWVSPDHQGCGVGSALIKSLEARIFADGHERAVINVASRNVMALKLYQHLGYEIRSRSVTFDPILGIELEKIGLSKSLK